jgi:hypothetical protein
MSALPPLPGVKRTAVIAEIYEYTPATLRASARSSCRNRRWTHSHPREIPIAAVLLPYIEVCYPSLATREATEQ